MKIHVEENEKDKRNHKHTTHDMFRRFSSNEKKNVEFSMKFKLLMQFFSLKIGTFFADQGRDDA